MEAADFLYGTGDLAAYRAQKVADGAPDDDAEILRRYAQQRGRRKPELAAEAARRFVTVPHEVRRLLNHMLVLAMGTASAEPEDAAADSPAISD